MLQAFTSYANRGKLIGRVAALRAAEKPVYVQNRLKIVFHKENV